MRRAIAIAIALVALLLAPAPADAASLRIRADSAVVSPAGRATIPLHNPDRRTAIGRLTLRAGKSVIGTASFRLPPRRTRPVRVELTVAGDRRLTRSGRLAATAVARVRGRRTVRRKLTLTASAPSPAAAAPAAPAPAAPAPSGPAWNDGRYQGRYEETNADLAFNVAGPRLYTGPFDRFYVEAVCRNVNPQYTGPDQVYPSPRAIEPVEARIAPDGSLRGEGSYHAGSGSSPVGWTITGQIGGGDVRGEFTAAFTDPYGNPCRGTTKFTGRYYGAYVIGT